MFVEDRVVDLAQELGALPADAPVAALTTFRVAAAHEARFVEEGVFLIASASRQPGVNAFALHRALGERPDGVEYVLYEDWQTRDAFAGHRGSAHLKRFHDAVSDGLIATPEQKLYVGWYAWKS